MNIDNPFDKKLEANHKMPESFRAALVDCIDTLDFCWAGARAVFGEAAKPEHAVVLLPTVLRLQAAERQAPASSPGAGTQDAHAPR